VSQRPTFNRHISVFLLFLITFSSFLVSELLKMDAETEGIPPVHDDTDSHVIDVAKAQRKRVLISQQSTVATRRQQAVCVRRAHKIYGTKKNPNVILDGLNMTVPKGTM